MEEYSLQSRNTSKHYIDIVKKIGFVDIKNDYFIITSDGKKFLETKDNLLVLKLLIEKIFGFEEILKLLTDKQTLDKTKIYKEIENKYHIGWETDNQILWRLYWLLSLEFVDVTSGKYYLTEKGIAALNEILKVEINKKKLPEKVIKKDLEEISHAV